MFSSQYYLYFKTRKDILTPSNTISQIPLLWAGAYHYQLLFTNHFSAFLPHHYHLLFKGFFMVNGSTYNLFIHYASASMRTSRQLRYRLRALV